MSPPELTEPPTDASLQQTLTKSGGFDRSFAHIPCYWTNHYLQVDHSVVKIRHKYRPRATALDWSNEHSKTYRLLDWLNLNRLEKDIMFSVPKQGRHPDAFKSRKDCFIEAAQHIFTLEDDPAIHCEISKDATRVATAIGNRVKR